MMFKRINKAIRPCVKKYYSNRKIVIVNFYHQTKQLEILKNRKEFVKKSVKLRTEKNNAIYKQKLINSQ